MIRHPAPAIGLLLATIISGCSYDRSFMQLDSNSGVPFFGFQWAVDSGSRPSKSASGNDDHETTPSLIDLRAPSKLDLPGRDHPEFVSENDDIQTVSIGPRQQTTFLRSSLQSTRPPAERVSAAARDAGSDRDRSDTMALVELSSGERSVTRIHAHIPTSRTSSTARQFQNRRAAF